MSLQRVSAAEVPQLRSFLTAVDLTLAGLDDSGVNMWIEHDDAGQIIGSTGFELSRDNTHVLIRSVAVRPDVRTVGAGSRLATFAMSQARALGATRAWLFSRRSGPFWQKLGFTAADRDELAAVLPDAHQVRLFVESGQLAREIAWSRSLADPCCSRIGAGPS